MTISQPGLKLIEVFEGLRLQAYKDSVGIPTIGYGHTDGVHMGDECTIEQAEKWLIEDVKAASLCVTHLLKVPITQNEFDALVSFTYNLGCGSLEKSTMLKHVNNSNTIAAANEFLKWNHAGGKVVEGLTTRRRGERLLFLGDPE